MKLNFSIAITFALLCQNTFALGPCKTDREKFCPDAKNKHEVVKCLRAHEKELSPDCKAIKERARVRGLKIKEVCQDDVRNLCKGVTPGEGRIVKCLKGSEEKLSAACKETLFKK